MLHWKIWWEQIRYRWSQSDSGCSEESQMGYSHMQTGKISRSDRRDPKLSGHVSKKMTRGWLLKCFCIPRVTMPAIASYLGRVWSELRSEFPKELGLGYEKRFR